MQSIEQTGSATSDQLAADAELAAIAASESASRALSAGMQAPAFSLFDGAGRQVSLDRLLTAGPVVVHFYRGAWCSYGEQNLVEFAAIQNKVQALGASAVTIGPACSLPFFETDLLDVDMKVARAYGLVFNLPASLQSRYKELGYFPPQVRGEDKSWLAPLPALYLIDRDGMILVASLELDYRRQFDFESLLSVLSLLQRKQAAHR